MTHAFCPGPQTRSVATAPALSPPLAALLSCRHLLQQAAFSSRPPPRGVPGGSGRPGA